MIYPPNQQRWMHAHRYRLRPDRIPVVTLDQFSLETHFVRTRTYVRTMTDTRVNQDPVEWSILLAVVLLCRIHVLRRKNWCLSSSKFWCRAELAITFAIDVRLNPVMPGIERSCGSARYIWRLYWKIIDQNEIIARGQSRQLRGSNTEHSIILQNVESSDRLPCPFRMAHCVNPTEIAHVERRSELNVRNVQDVPFLHSS